ncbi:hypothetical protein AALP_AA1G145600 [Arabis alpina]|uniref:Leucine-rich repeat-containing N-terminal plant-type domain-containing protein n=1 Tax=Arabis alpina TaxID=50452 RepID=A0A087HN85_ARAAL|nr:hypothetical protein AALP_AA1G145600 [Arabis alpina]
MFLQTFYSLLLLSLLFRCTGDESLPEVTDNDQAPMYRREREALYSAIQGFVGDSWNGSGLYPDPCGWSPIQGVSCDIYNDLWSNPGLIGKFPETIGNLTRLKSLVVLENGFNGALPASICNLKSLKKMVFAGNSFAGTIPNCFKELKELLILDLSRNSFSGTVPSSFGDLVSLLKLDLSNNLLEGNLPQEIGFLKNLTLLDLRNNKLSGGLSNNIEKIQSLTELVLSNNPMSEEDMMGGIKWEKMGSLVILDLSKMGLRGEFPIGLTKLKRLRFLGLNNNNLTGLVPSEKLEALPYLGALYINGNNLTGELRFSRKFYEKMGRRFKASKNPNLCQPLEKTISNYSHNKHLLPLGVKPCTKG